MTAATITENPRIHLAEENIVLTASDGETYVSSLSDIVGVHLTPQEELGLATAVKLEPSISGRTVTINATGMSDKKVLLTVKGYL